MKKIIYLLLIVSCWTACSQNDTRETTEKSPEATTNQLDKTVLAAEIKALEEKLVATKDAKKDLPAANQLIEKVELYANTFPQDSLTPYVLFRAGDVARGAGKPEKAIEIWEKNWRTYEEHRLAPGSLFAMAFTYDTEFDNYKEAERYYKKFIYKFPDHQLVPETKKLLRALHKSPEDLIKEFKKKEKENQ